MCENDLGSTGASQGQVPVRCLSVSSWRLTLGKETYVRPRPAARAWTIRFLWRPVAPHPFKDRTTDSMYAQALLSAWHTSVCLSFPCMCELRSWLCHCPGAPHGRTDPGQFTAMLRSRCALVTCPGSPWQDSLWLTGPYAAHGRVAKTCPCQENLVRTLARLGRVLQDTRARP